MQNQTPPQSNQDAFNRVWQHFIVEKNPRSVQIHDDGNPRCLYRTIMDGGKVNGCAIGCMMADKHYQREFENQSAESITKLLTGNGTPEVREWFTLCDTDFLRDIQLAHDNVNSERIDYFETSLRIVADEHKLTVPEKA